MSGTTLAFAIVTVVLLAKLVQTWIESRNQQPEVDEDWQDTLDKIERLEERIQVLERIVTENRYDLKREIDRL